MAGREVQLQMRQGPLVFPAFRAISMHAAGMDYPG